METLFLNIHKYKKIDKIWILNQFKNQFKTKRDRELLIFYTIKFIITQIQNFIQIKHLALYPDQQNEKLINHYLKIIPNSYKLKDKKEFWILMKVA